MPDHNRNGIGARSDRVPAAAATLGRERIWEIDFLRGLSIILMVGYPLLYDLGAMVCLRSFLGFSTDLSTPV